MNEFDIQGEEAIATQAQGPEQAIALALESKWEEAAALNRAILATHAQRRRQLEPPRQVPDRARTLPRRPRRLPEVDRARPRKHDRQAQPGPPVERQGRRRARASEAVAKVPRTSSSKRRARSGSTVLQEVSSEVLTRTVAGDEVYLKPDGTVLSVQNIQGEHIGIVEPKLGLRLLRLMQGGNKYAAAVKSVAGGSAEVSSRRSSATRARPPVLPGRGRGDPRLHTRILLRYEADDDDEEPSRKTARTTTGTAMATAARAAALSASRRSRTRWTSATMKRKTRASHQRDGNGCHG